jgi:hypothetical protein
MMEIREIEMVLAHQQREINGIKSQLMTLINKTPDWITPNEAAKLSGNKFSAHEIKRIVDRAIDNPLDTNLIDGIHYTRIHTGTQYRYKINWSLMSQVI